MAWAIHKKAALEISNPDFNWTVADTVAMAEASEPATIIASLGDRLGLIRRVALHSNYPAQGRSEAGSRGSSGKSGNQLVEQLSRLTRA